AGASAGLALDLLQRDAVTPRQFLARRLHEAKERWAGAEDKRLPIDVFQRDESGHRLVVDGEDDGLLAQVVRIGGEGFRGLREVDGLHSLISSPAIRRMFPSFRPTARMLTVAGISALTQRKRRDRRNGLRPKRLM